MTATHDTNCTASFAPVLYLALDLGASNWKLAFTVGLGQKPRLKTITARSTLSLVLEIKAAKKRFGLPEDAPVLCCYEAGRDGFWLHRFLLAHGVQNQVVDSSSIEVNRRQRRAKSDRLDAVKLAAEIRVQGGIGVRGGNPVSVHLFAWRTATTAGLAADAELLFRKAVLHRKAAQPAEAESCWRRVLTLRRPEQFCNIDQGIYGHLTLRNLAVLVEERGDPGEAAALWEKSWPSAMGTARRSPSWSN